MAKLLKNLDGKVLLPKDIFAYFNGVDSSILYSGLSNFAWMTVGVFSMEFETIIDVVANKTLFYTAYFTNQFGFSISIASSKLRFNWYNGPGSLITKDTTTNIAPNTKYRVRITGDGSNLRYIVYNDGGLFYDSGLYAVTFVSNATTSYGLRIGNYAGINFYSFYLRNLRISKQTEPFFFAPLQDNSNIAYEVIGNLTPTVAGTVQAINKVDTEKWAYFNGTTACIGIGSTSTLGWMNSGTFYLEFDIIPLTTTIHKHIFSTAASATNRGIRVMSITGPHIQVAWYNGTTAYTATAISTYTAGKKYKLVVRADGTKLYFTSYNEDGSVNRTNEPGGLAVTFVANATTTYNPTLASSNVSLVNTYNYNCKIKNFKICTDSLGTVPFVYMPLQNIDNLIEELGGSGAAIRPYSVACVDETYKTVLAKNIFADFSTSPYNNYITLFATVSSFNFIHQKAQFVIEFDIYFRQNTSPQQIFYTATSASSNGSNIYIDNSATQIRFHGYRGGGNYVFVAYSPVLTNNTQYHIKAVGNGTTVTVYANNVAGTPAVVSGYSTSDALGNGLIGRGSTGYITYSYIRNLKFYNEYGELVYFFPLNNNASVTANAGTAGGQATTHNGIIKQIEID